LSLARAFDSSIPADLNTDRIILMEIRLPRILFGLVVGASLAMAGAVFQAILRNDLATPYTLGVSGGAAFGALAAMTLFRTGTPVGAIAGAALAISVILVLASGTSALSRIETLILAGVTLNLLFGAAIQILQFKANPYEVYGMVRWMMGGLDVASMRIPALLCIPLGAGFVILLWQARFLNAATFGDAAAAHLGFDPERQRFVALGVASVLTALVVGYAGPVGFVGLIVPHAVRRLTGPDNRIVLPCVVLTGAAFLVACDTIARAAGGLFVKDGFLSIPVGIVTACVGGPVFLWILFRRQSPGGA